MELGLKDKSVVITGGATGIGKAVALEYLREGARVTILARRESVMQEAAEEARKEGLTLDYMVCDVTDRAALEHCADAIDARCGGIDIWYNNAGISMNVELLDLTDEQFDAVTNTNQKAVFVGIQVAARHMIPKGKGVIVNASSFASKIPHSNGILYGMTKAAVSSLTRSCAAALAPYGIRVYAYIPGMIVTPISEEMVAQYREQYTKDIALGRLGRPEDLSKVLVFLSSDCAAYVNGCDVEITGGKFAVQDCSLGWKAKRAREEA